MPTPGPMELVIILVILLFVFGGKKLPGLARSMGQASKEFKQGLKEGPKETPPVEGPCPYCAVNVPEDSKFCPGCGKSAEDIVAARAKEQTPKSA